MSLASLDQFRNALTADPALQQACLDAFNAGRHEDVLAIGKQLGFEFSAEEVKQRFDDAELSDFELELVSAGIIIPPSIKGTQKSSQLR